MSISLKNITDNSSVKVYLNKIGKRITFKTKTEYYLGILKPGTMNLFGSTEKNKTKCKNSKNVPNLEITEVALVHCCC